MTALRFVRSVSLGVLSGYIGAGASLRVTAAKPGLVNFELDIQKEHTNRLNILHGGTIASMVDLGGSLAVASRGLFATGVSTDLNVTYLSSGGKVGDKILASAKRSHIHLSNSSIVKAKLLPAVVTPNILHSPGRTRRTSSRSLAGGSHEQKVLYGED
ncbi:unnamed protein product [Aspergillus oryzae RIB40]|uniref:DNA, SC206 n=1 Tax=Aspergillus oryzae (strain ATCC 42149 / RIB 40) TaxID=510516 RepID=Q2PIU6_ASPOR|nr:unnamed protein product [Aspergillus oryzae RIB40]BAE65428.1 unnamed protein product [Aspergillus oryzae RIB40]